MHSCNQIYEHQQFSDVPNSISLSDLLHGALDDYLFLFRGAICLLDKVTQSSCPALLQCMHIHVLVKEMANIYDTYCHQADIKFLFCIFYD